MADPTNNPQSVGNRAAQQAVNSLGNAVPNLTQVESLLTSIAKQVENATNGTEAWNKSFSETVSSYRVAVVQADTLIEKHRALADMVRTMSRQSYGIKNNEQLARALTQAAAEMKKLSAESRLAAREQAAINDQVKLYESMLVRIAGERKEALNTELLDKFSKGLGEVVEHTKNLGREFKNLRLTGLEGDIDRASKSLRHLFHAKDREAKYHQHAATAHEHREEREMERERRTVLHDKKRGAFSSEYSRLGNLRIRPKGESSFRNLTSVERTAAAGRATGVGGFAASIMAHAEQDKLLGRPSSMVTSLGMKALSMGEGSLLKGALAMGGEGIAGVAGGISELAGPLAPVLAALEITRELYDKNNKMNKDVQTKLGAGGLYSGKGDAADALRNVRGNLNSIGGIGEGIGYEKNLEIAHSLAQGGFSIQDLAERDNSKNVHGGFLEGGFGSLQRNVYRYGKLAGFDSSQTMAQTIKLVTQYRLSLSATEDFFLRINQAARTAGMSTSKYVEVIDDLNSHFDRTNKLLEVTVSTMKLLGMTGQATTEDIKEAAGALGNNGKAPDQPTGIYAYANLIKQGHLPQFQKTLEVNEGMSLHQYVQDRYSKLSPEERQKKEKEIAARVEKYGPNAISSLMREDETNSSGSFQKIATSQALSKYQKANQWTTLTRNATSSGNATQQATALQQLEKTMGTDIIHQYATTLSLLETGMKKFGLGGESMDLKSVQKLFLNPKISAYLETMGLKPENLPFIEKAIQLNSGARLHMMQEGITSDESIRPGGYANKKAVLDELYTQLAASGKIPELNLKNPDHVKALKDLAAKAEPGSDLELRIFQEFNRMRTARDEVNPAYIKAMVAEISNMERQQAASDSVRATVATSTTEDFWKDGLTYVFNQLIKPLGFIADVIGKIIPGGYSEDSGRMQELLDRLMSKLPHGIPEALGKMQREISHLDESIGRTNPNSASGKKLQAQRDALENHRSELEFAQKMIEGGMAGSLDSGQRKWALQLVRLVEEGNWDELKKAVNQGYSPTGGTGNPTDPTPPPPGAGGDTPGGAPQDGSPAAPTGFGNHSVLDAAGKIQPVEYLRPPPSPNSRPNSVTYNTYFGQHVHYSRRWVNKVNEAAESMGTPT